MKKAFLIRAIVVLVLSLLAPVAGAQSTTSAGGVTGAAEAALWALATTATPRQTAGAADTPQISGHCTYVVPRGVMATVCSEVMIVLLDDKGNTLQQTRTDQNGDFSFDVEAGKSYRLKSGSTNYVVVVSPTLTFTAGQRVQLKLRHQ